MKFDNTNSTETKEDIAAEFRQAQRKRTVSGDDNTNTTKEAFQREFDITQKTLDKYPATDNQNAVAKDAETPSSAPTDTPPATPAAQRSLGVDGPSRPKFGFN